MKSPGQRIKLGPWRCIGVLTGGAVRALSFYELCFVLPWSLRDLLRGRHDVPGQTIGPGPWRCIEVLTCIVRAFSFHEL